MASSEFNLENALNAIGRAGTRPGVVSEEAHLNRSPRHHDRYVSVTMEFRCNLKCVHCMIEGTMDRLNAVPDAEFEAICADQAETGRWTGLILTGSEITLRKDLDQIAKKARAAGFRHIQIQTHGMHLGRTDYADRLVEAGIDEFFVSVAGSDRQTHDDITQVQGAWDKMMAGLCHLDRYDHVRILTNSVVTTRSYALLPGMVAALSHLKRLIQMEFWTFFPMREDDPKGLMASFSDIQPYLLRAIGDARALGRRVEVKNFPECLLDGYRDTLVNAQATLMIDPAFWEEFDRNAFYGCPHQESCQSRECLGLTRAYLDKFGPDHDPLSPL